MVIPASYFHHLVSVTYWSIWDVEAISLLMWLAKIHNGWWHLMNTMETPNYHHLLSVSYLLLYDMEPISENPRWPPTSYKICTQTLNMVINNTKYHNRSYFTIWSVLYTDHFEIRSHSKLWTNWMKMAANSIQNINIRHQNKN